MTHLHSRKERNATPVSDGGDAPRRVKVESDEVGEEKLSMNPLYVTSITIGFIIIDYKDLSRYSEHTYKIILISPRAD